MEQLIALQIWLYTGAMDALDASRTAGLVEMPVLVASAFAFGLLHALLPDHGKSLLASYYAAEGWLLGAVGSSAILIGMHVGVAVVLVLGGFAVVERGIVDPGGAPELERASQRSPPPESWCTLKGGGGTGLAFNRWNIPRLIFLGVV